MSVNGFFLNIWSGQYLQSYFYKVCIIVSTAVMALTAHTHTHTHTHIYIFFSVALRPKAGHSLILEVF
jgi:hypothetical protein